MEVQVAETDLCQVTESVWETVLGMHVNVIPREVPPSTASSICGYVRISGAWEGAIALESSPALARRVAAALLGTDPAETTDEEIYDAFGELTNIIGGNIKGMLPGPSKLSVPAIRNDVRCESVLPGTVALLRADFDCEGEPVRIALVVSSPAA